MLVRVFKKQVDAISYEIFLCYGLENQDIKDWYKVLVVYNYQHIPVTKEMKIMNPGLEGKEFILKPGSASMYTSDKDSIVEEEFSKLYVVIDSENGKKGNPYEVAEEDDKLFCIKYANDIMAHWFRKR